MPVEPREVRRVTQYSLTPEVCEDGPFRGYVKLHWIRSAAEARKGERVHALMHHINPYNLRRAFRELDGSRACGIDGVTKQRTRLGTPFRSETPTEEPDAGNPPVR